MHRERDGHSPEHHTARMGLQRSKQHQRERKSPALSSCPATWCGFIAIGRLLGSTHSPVLALLQPHAPKGPRDHQPPGTAPLPAPSRYLSSSLRLAASCSASSPRISSTRGWYSKMILRKPCRKGMLLPPGGAPAWQWRLAPRRTVAGRRQQGLNSTGFLLCSNKRGFGVI